VAAALHAAWPRSWARRLELRAAYPDGATCVRVWTRRAALLLLGGELDGCRLAGWSFAKRMATDHQVGDDDSLAADSGSVVSNGSGRYSLSLGSCDATSAGSEGADMASSPGASLSSESAAGAHGPQYGQVAEHDAAILWLSSDGGGPGVHWRVGRFLRAVASERSRVIKGLRLAVNET
jgi:hypothetical protein